MISRDITDEKHFDSHPVTYLITGIDKTAGMIDKDRCPLKVRYSAYLQRQRLFRLEKCRLGRWSNAVVCDFE